MGRKKQDTSKAPDGEGEREKDDEVVDTDGQPENDDGDGAPKQNDAARKNGSSSDEIDEKKTQEEEPDAKQEEPNANEEETTESSKPVKLYKSSRLKGYLTLVLASIINYDAAEKSDDVIAVAAAVPATDGERNYAISVSLISLSMTALILLVHLDTITPLEKLWVKLFQPKSRFELFLILFLCCWWSVATGIQTSVRGIAGDGKGQYSLYFSSWVCCFTSFWVLERWWVASGLASLKAFITSWPYRSPGWLCILFMGIFTLIWYLDLWTAHSHLDREEEEVLRAHFEDVPEIQWKLLVSLLVLTIAPAAVFVLIEIFRETKADGTNKEKKQPENVAEGLSLLALILCWIPCIIWVTVPKGAASLIGNAYFSSWLLVIFIAETGVWFVHDLRERIHQSLEQKQLEYRLKQRQVIERAQAIQRQKLEQKVQKDRPTVAAPNMTLDELKEYDDVVDVDEEGEDSSEVSFMDALTDF